MRKTAAGICIMIAALLLAGCPADTGNGNAVPSWLSGRTFECVEFSYEGQTVNMDAEIRFDDNEIYLTINDNALLIPSVEEGELFSYLDEYHVRYMINQYPTGDMYAILIPEYGMTINMSMVLNQLNLVCRGEVNTTPINFEAILVEK